MPEPCQPADAEPTDAEKLQALAHQVRESSAELRVVPLGHVWTGTEEEYLLAAGTEAMAGCEDIVCIRDGGRTYLYSERRMTRPYAEAVARTQCDDKRHTIAETVRADSLTYPRPTPLSSFSESPFRLSPETVAAAVEAFAGDPNFSDIEQICASDGTPFLFSSAHMTAPHARALAEWVAVESLQNW
jgi:hypothetical protein